MSSRRGTGIHRITRRSPPRVVPGRCTACGTRRAPSFIPGLTPHGSSDVVNAGRTRDAEGYSGFEDTPLERLLREHDVDTVHVGGLALDYCVKATALDAKRAGFDVIVHRGATRPVEVAPGDGDRAVQELREAGVQVVD